MKKILPLISFLLTITVVSAQVKIGDAPKKINPNALLELESQNKGMLIPRMTTAQRDRAFTLDVPNGLMIFNTDEKAVQVWLSDSAQWQSLSVPEDKPQQISLENHILRLSDGGTVDLSPYIDTDTDTDTDDQQLSLYGNLLSLTDGGTVDLTSLLPRSGTDSQTVSTSHNEGREGYYWSSGEFNLNGVVRGVGLYFDSGSNSANTFSYIKSLGFSVRCIMD